MKRQTTTVARGEVPRFDRGSSMLLFPSAQNKAMTSEEEHMLKDISIDEIEMWLTLVMAARDVVRGGGKHLFSPWERDFIVSLNASYDAKHVSGYHIEPLSLKQLFYLKRMYDLLVKDTMQNLELIADREHDDD